MGWCLCMAGANSSRPGRLVGFETSSHAATWALMCIATHPEVRAHPAPAHCGQQALPVFACNAAQSLPARLLNARQPIWPAPPGQPSPGLPSQPAAACPAPPPQVEARLVEELRGLGLLATPDCPEPRQLQWEDLSQASASITTTAARSCLGAGDAHIHMPPAHAAHPASPRPPSRPSSPPPPLSPLPPALPPARAAAQVPECSAVRVHAPVPVCQPRDHPLHRPPLPAWTLQAAPGWVCTLRQGAPASSPPPPPLPAAHHQHLCHARRLLALPCPA